jgi:hypothetical protein
MMVHLWSLLLIQSVAQHLSFVRYKKNLEPTPAGADRIGLTVLKVGSMEHYVQSTSSKLQAMCGNWNLLGLTMRVD